MKVTPRLSKSAGQQYRAYTAPRIALTPRLGIKRIPTLRRGVVRRGVV
jgi:hypothetical protein